MLEIDALVAASAASEFSVGFFSFFVRGFRIAGDFVMDLGLAGGFRGLRGGLERTIGSRG